MIALCGECQGLAAEPLRVPRSHFGRERWAKLVKETGIKVQWLRAVKGDTIALSEVLPKGLTAWTKGLRSTTSI